MIILETITVMEKAKIGSFANGNDRLPGSHLGSFRMAERVEFLVEDARSRGDKIIECRWGRAIGQGSVSL